MRATKIVGLCVVATCALLLLGVSNSIALPGSLEFGACTATVHGKFKNSACTKPAKTRAEEKFEWTPVTAGGRFTSEKKPTAGNLTLTAAGSSQRTAISCTGYSQAEGEYHVKELRHVVWDLSGCTDLEGESCSSGGVSGVIQTEPLQGAAGVIVQSSKEAKNKDGWDLKPEENFHEFKPFARFSCVREVFVVRGAVIVPVPTNKMLNKRELVYRAFEQAQVPASFWGGNEEFLEVLAAEHERAGLNLVMILKTGGKVELRQCEVNIC
jgi:hypothetical protein